MLTWSTTNKSANYLVSNGGLDLTGQTINGLGKTTLGKSSGKVYFEIKVVILNSNSRVGLASGSASVDQLLGAAQWPNAIGWKTNGDDASGYFGNMGGFAEGDVIGFAIDFSTNNITLRKNNVQVFTNSFFNNAGPWFPAASCGSGGVMRISGNSSNFTYTPPAGYSAWDDGTTETLGVSSIVSSNFNSTNLAAFANQTPTTSSTAGGQVNGNEGVIPRVMRVAMANPSNQFGLNGFQTFTVISAMAQNNRWASDNTYNTAFRIDVVETGSSTVLQSFTTMATNPSGSGTPPLTTYSFQLNPAYLTDKTGNSIELIFTDIGSGAAGSGYDYNGLKIFTVYWQSVANATAPAPVFVPGGYSYWLGLE